MIPSTAQALVIIATAVLPGATYTWSFERQAGAFGVTLADRSLRFISASAVFHLLLAWLEYVAWRVVFVGAPTLTVGRFAVLWAIVLLLVGLPASTGWTAGVLYASRNQREMYPRLRAFLRLEGDAGAVRETQLVQLLLGRAPAPRAWDFLFGSNPAGYVRVQLKGDGSWVGGVFGPKSYASGYPENPGDIFLEKGLQMKQDDGTFIIGENGAPTPTGGGILVRWDEGRVIEFIPVEE